MYTSWSLGEEETEGVGHKSHSVGCPADLSCFKSNSYAKELKLGATRPGRVKGAGSSPLPDREGQGVGRAGSNQTLMHL